MSETQVLSPGRLVRRRHVVATLFGLIATFACADSVFAQLFQWTPDQLVKYTSKNPYDRFPDGRPKVPARKTRGGDRQKSLFAEAHPVVDRLRELDLDGMTPIAALQELHRLREQAGR